MAAARPSTRAARCSSSRHAPLLHPPLPPQEVLCHLFPGYHPKEVLTHLFPGYHPQEVVNARLFTRLRDELGLAYARPLTLTLTPRALNP